MKSLLINFLNLLFTLLFAFSVSAQGAGEEAPVSNLGTVTNDGEGSGTKYIICLGENFQFTAKVDVRLGSLDIMGEEPNEYGVLPSLVPNMHVEFTINDEVYYVEVGNFDIVPNGTVMAFSYIAESPPIDFTNECNIDQLGGSESGDLYVTVSYRLVTQVTVDPETYTVYPACDYQNSLFSCHIYTYAPWCEATAMGNLFGAPDDPDPVCYDEWFSGKYSAELICDCDVEPGPPNDDPITGDGESLENDDDTSNRFIIANKINVFPNPMGQLMQVESSVESIRQIEIYNLRGDLILNNTYNADENHKVSLNTAALPGGLYLVRIATISGVEVLKILK